MEGVKLVLHWKIKVKFIRSMSRKNKLILRWKANITLILESFFSKYNIYFGTEPEINEVSKCIILNK